MKKIYTTFQNENVQAAVIIATVFLLIGLVSLFIIFN
jgi:ABC-type sulfate transport system permease component